MPWHEVYSPRSPTGVRPPAAPPYLYLYVGDGGAPRHARGGGVGWGAMDGRGRGRAGFVQCTDRTRDAKKPGQRMASRV